MKINDVISVFGVAITALDESLDLYSEWEKFTKDGKNVDQDDFLDYLIDDNKVTESSDHDGVLDIYFSLANIPSVDDMARVKESMGIHYVNLPVRNRELLATGYLQELFVELKWTKDDYFTWLADKSITTQDKLIVIFRGIIKSKRKEDVSKHGFSIQMVSGNPGDKWGTYGYTVGLSGSAGYELVVVNGGPIAANILSSLSKQALDKSLELDKILTLLDFKVVDGGGLRVVIKDIDLDSPTANGCLGKIGNVTNIKQIFLGDSNNILPGEGGYDTGFVQTLTEESKG